MYRVLKQVKSYVKLNFLSPQHNFTFYIYTLTFSYYIVFTVFSLIIKLELSLDFYVIFAIVAKQQAK